MSDMKTRGIVLKTSDHKDDDKLIRLYTLEQGKMTALMRGVKKSGAKLKIPSQVFCFGEYILSGSKNLPIVTGCTVEESFFSLAADPDKFSAAASVMEIMEKALPDGESNPPVFIQALKTMKELLKADAAVNADREDKGKDVSAACKTILLNFMLQFFKLSGYNLKLEKCCVCGEKYLRERMYEFAAGGVVCRICATVGAVNMSPLCNAVMLAAADCPTDRLHTLALDIKGLSEALSLCRVIAESIFECKILSSFFN